MRGIPFALLILLLAARAPVSAEEGPLRIASITPGGTEVPPGRQIVIQFDRPVVPVGRMERRPEEVPVRIEPALSCEWRFIDPSALACQLTEANALRPATRYRVTVSPGIVTEDGNGLERPFEHVFDTETPTVTSSSFEEWLGPGSPELSLTFNQRMTETELESRLRFESEGGASFPVEVELLDPTVEEPERFWRLRAARELPPGVTVHLTAQKGLTSLEGPLPTAVDRRVVTTYTFPGHEFLGVRCWDNEGKELFLRSSAALPGKPCNPMATVEVVFASPVINEVLRDGLEIEPELAAGREDYDPWESLYSYSRRGWARSEGDTYGARLPELLRARTSYSIRARGAEILDEFGRPLEKDIDFLFTTDDRPPGAVLTHPVSILEKDVDTHVPIVLTNLESFEVDFESRTAEGTKTAKERVEAADALNVSYRFPLPTRAWLGGRSGALFGTITTSPPVEMYPHRFFSQVTPFAVHTKLGHRNTAVWVTDMSSGEPVAGARVALYRAAPLEALREQEVLAESTTDAAGVALLSGQSDLNPLLETTRYQRLWDPEASPAFFVSVEKDGELALAPLASDFWVYPEGGSDGWIPTYVRTKYGHVRAWGTTAQGVYRLGDVVQYKIYVRDQTNETFVPAPRRRYELTVYDPMQKVVHEAKGIELNSFGAHQGEFPLAPNGAVGWYRFELRSDFHPESWEPLRVLVADFTPAPFRVTTDLDGERYEPGETVEVATSAKLHAGGPYADAEARITATVVPTKVSSSNPKAAGFDFGGVRGEAVTFFEGEASVDSMGELSTSVVVSDQGFPRGRLTIESSVRDDRGKYVAGRASADYLGRDRFVGIRAEGWLLRAGDASEVNAIVVDPKDEVTAGSEIAFRVDYRRTTASRVKGAGNAYVTQYNHEWVELLSCREESALDPVTCRFTPDKPGLYRLTASIADSKGRPIEVTTNRWAQGKGQVLWEESPGHRLDVEPEKSEYRVGERARFLVRNPFPGARALLTIERYGVQRHWVETFDESTEVIEIEITEDHLPGFYFGAIVTSPRVEAPLGDDEVDLGKPAFRMGYARIPVRDPAKEIGVEVAPERTMYKPREKVKVELRAKPKLWAGSTAPPIELAVAVLDEAVFDLIGGGDAYFDPYRGFYDLEPLDVENFNLLTRLVGIQKFEKKGANPGGDGGGGPDLRTLFKFVSYWNPSVAVDENGRAEIEFEVPDNLTGFRILALAVTEDDRMGLGQGTFVVNRETEIRPALPNQVTEGDRFEARFTVMNRTEEVRVLTVTASVEGPVESAPNAETTLEAEPYQRYPVSFPVRTTGAGDMIFTVSARDLVDGDALVSRLPVGRREALEVSATYGTTIEPNTVEPFLFPENMRTDVGRVSVVASPSVLGNLEGAFEYLRDYPYACWEQKLTKAIMASHYRELRSYMKEDFDWPGHEALPGEILALAPAYQAPGGGMTYWVPEDEYQSPYLSAYTALAFQWLSERGYDVPGGVETKLHAYLNELLRTDVFPEFYTQGMSSTVRAVALAALAEAGSLERADLERYRAHVPRMDLFGKAHFLMAAKALQADASEVETQILSHANRTGGKVSFTETVDDEFERILFSPERTQCAVLSAFTRGAASPQMEDLPFRLTRAISDARKKRDRWENTQENVFCMNALVDFARAYERETPRYTLRTYFDGNAMGESAFDDLRDAPMEHARELNPGDPGRRSELRISKLGPGRVYYSARLHYSPRELKREPVNSGIEVRREYSVRRSGAWTLLAQPMRVVAGELVKVDLFVSLPAPRNFVVVDDPVPGGLEPVNRDLATASSVDADRAEFEGDRTSFFYTRDDWFYFGYSRFSFYHQELSHDAVRFYSEYLPAGSYHLSYVAQAIAPGEFQVLPLHAEEMYDPDVFGQGSPETLLVEPMN